MHPWRIGETDEDEMSMRINGRRQKAEGREVNDGMVKGNEARDRQRLSPCTEYGVPCTTYQAPGQSTLQ